MSSTCWQLDFLVAAVAGMPFTKISVGDGVLLLTTVARQKCSVMHMNSVLFDGAG